MGKDIREDISWAQINQDVLKSLESPRKLYWVIVFVAMLVFSVGVGCEVYQYNIGIGRGEHGQSACLGVVHRHLHLLDRHEPLRDFAVGDSAFDACGLA